MWDLVYDIAGLSGQPGVLRAAHTFSDEASAMNAHVASVQSSLAPLLAQAQVGLFSSTSARIGK